MAEKCNTFVFESPAAKVSIVPPMSKPGFVFTPGSPGPAGRDLQIDGTAENYEALLSVTPVRVGELWQVLDTGMIYTWTDSGWPAEDQGRLLQGPQGETGRGISALSVDGDDLVASMTRGPVERVQVPSIVASAESAAAAASSAVLADGHRQSAWVARTGAETAQGEAEVHAVAAGEHADAADSSADAAASSEAQAGAHAVAAAGHADRAEGAETGAEQFAIEAGEYVDTASVHAATATGAAEQASVDRQAVAQDRSEVEVLAAGVSQVVDDGAAAVRAEVADDVTAAQNARQASEAARDLSQGHAGTASTKATEAAADRAAAQTARTGAETARDEAEGHAESASTHATQTASDRQAAQAAHSGAETARDEAGDIAYAEAVRASSEKLMEFVGTSPPELDTFYELVAAFQARGDILDAMHDALANRVTGAFSIVVSTEPPPPGTPENVFTFVKQVT